MKGGSCGPDEKVFQYLVGLLVSHLLTPQWVAVALLKLKVTDHITQKANAVKGRRTVRTVAVLNITITPGILKASIPT